MEHPFTFFVLLNATPAWLALDRQTRRDFVEKELNPLFADHPEVKVRFYDAEAFTGRCSDIAVFEAEDIREYYFLMEGLRDSKLYTVPYFEVVDIIPAIEEGFAEYEDRG